MSKVCLTAMTRVHQQEFDREEPKRNIVINSCCPGYVKTDMTGQWGLVNADQGTDLSLLSSIDVWIQFNYEYVY